MLKVINREKIRIIEILFSVKNCVSCEIFLL